MSNNVYLSHFAISIHRIHIKLAKQYAKLIRDKLSDSDVSDSDKEALHRLLMMCHHIVNIPSLDASNDLLYVDKWSRWIGYIQSGMVAFKMTTVDEERDRTRRMFHAMYKRLGLPKPKTVSLSIQDSLF